jgi:hypothetical protein
MDVSSLPPQLQAALKALSAVMRRREPAIREQVRRLRAEHPGLSDEQLARILVRDTRRRVAGTGALSGAVAIVPALGTVAAIGSLTGQSLYALEQQTELVLAIAMLFGHELEESDERLLEALVVVGLAGGAVKLRQGVLVAGGQRMALAAFRRLPQLFLERAGGHVLGRILGRLTAGSIVRAAPLAVGLAAGTTFDYLSVTLLGRAAIRYYRPGGPAAGSGRPGAGVAARPPALRG